MAMSGISAYLPVVGTEKVHRTCNLVSSGIWMFLYGGLTIATFIAFLAFPQPEGGLFIFVSSAAFLMSCLVYLWIRAVHRGSPNLMIPWMVHIFVEFVGLFATFLCAIKVNATSPAYPHSKPYPTPDSPIPGWAIFLMFCLSGLLGLQFAYMFGLYNKLKESKRHIPLSDLSDQV